jgi:hypothetical protein
MEELLPNTNADVIRELLLIVFGLIVRAIEKRKLKKSVNAQSED